MNTTMLLFALTFLVSNALSSNSANHTYLGLIRSDSTTESELLPTTAPGLLVQKTNEIDNVNKLSEIKSESQKKFSDDNKRHEINDLGHKESIANGSNASSPVLNGINPTLEENTEMPFITQATSLDNTEESGDPHHTHINNYNDEVHLISTYLPKDIPVTSEYFNDSASTNQDSDDFFLFNENGVNSFSTASEAVISDMPVIESTPSIAPSITEFQNKKSISDIDYDGGKIGLNTTPSSYLEVTEELNSKYIKTNFEDEDFVQADQPFSPENITPSPLTMEPEEPVGASLAFIFDSTGSMQDELNQVKVGASQILSALLANEEIVIHNFILVPFNDPIVGPVSATREPKVFQRMIDEITVGGGGDCPEMSIGGIKKALEVARPNSYIYVFTDASAKDYKHQDEVLALIQQLQPQVVFILTGTCEDEMSKNYAAYQSLADASSGQVYHLSKSEVREVLKYVKGSLKTNKVNLLSLNRPAPPKNTPDKHSVVVDETLKEFTVSVSGKNASIAVHDPEGVPRSNTSNVEPLLTLQNVKIVNVREPNAGTWQLSVDSESEYSIRATGRSAVNFRHGFSSVLTSDMAETNMRPLKGASCYLVIQVSEAGEVNLTTVKILGLNGKDIQTLSLSPHPSSPTTFSVAHFSPPVDFFHMEISGFGKDGLPIKRVTSTAISSSLPEKPKISMRERTVSRIHSASKISCHVTSLVPFTVVWFRDSRPVTVSVTHPQTCTVDLPIANVTESSEGNYTCKVKNIAGMDWKTSILTVTGPPPLVFVDSRVVAMNGDNIDLVCNVTSSFHTSVRWAQLSTRSNYSGILHSVLRGKVFNNHSLVLQDVGEADEGWYVCSAESRAGRGEARVFLQVRHPLRVTVSPASVSFVKGDSLKLVCNASGLPPPTLQWRRDLIAITNSDPWSFLEEINGQLHLLLDHLDEKRAGVYTCVASNNDESVSGQAELFFTEKPKIKARVSNVIARAGAEAVLYCDASGIPAPIVTWRRNGHVLHSDEHIQVSNGTVNISRVDSADAAEFTCIARNVAGENMDYIGLLVGSPPMFLQKPRDKKIQVGHNGTLFCTVTGSPPPDISWSRLDGHFDGSRMTTQPGGSLRITHAQVRDAGRYRCAADNLFGNLSADVNVVITGIAKPAADRSLNFSEARVIAGGAVSLPCGVGLGNPPGSVTWLLNGVKVADSDSSNVIDGRLEIAEALEALGGEYTCFVSNDLGNASRTFELNILESPHIEEGNSTENEAQSVEIGGKITLICPAIGNPRPKITWFTKHGPVKISATTYQDMNGNLVLEKVEEDKNGLYTCTGTNELGSTSAQISLQVLVPPRVTEDVAVEEEVVEGHVVVLNCQMHAVPSPRVSWFKDNSPLPSGEETSQILRFVANLEDGGSYRCVVTNAAGTASKEFNLNILVPPRITDPGDEPVQATAGGVAVLKCGVVGVPMPDILWRRHGSYMNENSSDVTLAGVSLILNNVSEDAGGAYVCEAENLAGIAQQTFYLQVKFAPRIIEEEDTNSTSNVTLREGEEFSLPCLSVGSPRPEVQWTKDGEPLHPYLKGIIVMGDNTLMFVDLRGDHSGLYVCRATNTEGSAEKSFTLHVATPPILLADLPNRIEVAEGDSLRLTCPTSISSNTIIHWIKDGRPLSSMLVERGDESPMKLTGDARQLLLGEAHPVDSGNYSCIAVNSAGRTDATFTVFILMTPHFEEFNHVARRTVLTGGSVNLNCSVSGNPPPQVNWRKDSVSIVPGRPPGVLLSRDQQNLAIPSARVQHTGTYTCIATNKITSKEREFYITVLEPPRIEGNPMDDVEVMYGEKLSLHCPAAGEPAPQIMWYAEDCDGFRRPLNITDAHLTFAQAHENLSTIYICEAISTAGTASKHFNVTVLAPPVIEEGIESENLQAVEGENVSLRCKIRGLPRPEVSWLHNGVEVNLDRAKRSRREVSENGTMADSENGDMVAFLNLTQVSEDAEGVYTVVASNRAGFTEKHYHLTVSVAPRIFTNSPSELTVIAGRKSELLCPIEAITPAVFSWKLPSLAGTFEADERFNMSDASQKFTINNTLTSDAGNYTCTATNSAGNLSTIVVLHVLEPPRFPDGSGESLEALVAESLVLNCSAVGNPTPSISWLKGPHIFSESVSSYLNLTNLDAKDSGKYTCIASNVAGAAEKVFNVQVLEPPVLRDAAIFGENYINVTLYRRFHLRCPIGGHPQPQIVWFKGNEKLTDTQLKVQTLSQGKEIVILAAGPEHSGSYNCIANNSVGTEVINFQVTVYVSAHWTSWSEWSSPCSVSCGSGVESRYRICSFGSGHLDPRLLVDKSLCVGNDREQRPCYVECEIDGAWSNWSEWSECSESCGNGTRQRERTCTNPAPSVGGKMCDGAFIEIEHCRQKPCLSLWSSWSGWSECSLTCGGGERRRFRSKVDGINEADVEVCNTQQCPGKGKWLPWTQWGPCSATCGKGVMRRVRHCKVSLSKERHCKDKVQMEVCHAQPCSAKLQITGELNGKILDAEVNADLSGNKLKARSALDAESSWFPYAPLLLAPVAWNTAVEEDSAANGYSLTGGRFLTQSDISFVTGEGLRVRTEGRGLDADGQFTVEIEVAGEAPIIEPSASVQIKSLHQDFVQVEDDVLMGLTEDRLLLDDQEIPFSMNSSIRYDNIKGQMPYLVEKLSMTDIQSDEAAGNERTFSAAASVSRKFEENVCPAGFIHDERHLLCSDLDECSSDPCESGKVCINTWGSYSCACPSGYLGKPNGGCSDVNECDQRPLRCHHSCANTDGSYYCLCALGYLLLADGSTCTENEESSEGFMENVSSEDNWIARRDLSDRSGIRSSRKNHVASCLPGYAYADQWSDECVDINECQETPSVCSEDSLCLNTPGSFQCLDIPCPQGFFRQIPTTSCTAECDSGACRRGASIAETVVFALLHLNSTDVRLFEDILQLTVNERSGEVRQKARLIEGTALRLRTVDSIAALYAPVSLKTKTLYRVVAEVSSLNQDEELLYSTEFIVYIIINS